MPAINFIPVRNFFSNFDRFVPPEKWRSMIGTARSGLRLRPRTDVFQPGIRHRQDSLLGSGAAYLHQRATITRMSGFGPVPTIVLGGFVPDSTESVFVTKNMLLRHGSVYCVNYPKTGFNLDLLFAQLDDLVDEINLRHHREPAIFSISFGAGLALEWLRRRRVMGGQHAIRALVMVSPVTCVDDLIERGRKKPTTLLGRAIQPYLSPESFVDRTVVERSRGIFTKMFEAGAQNRSALLGLMAPSDVRTLKERVLETIRGIDFNGACERVGALRSFVAPDSLELKALLPLAEVPTLILYSEKEDSVITESAPSRRAFETEHQRFFPRSRCLLVTNRRRSGTPVQHASLIFHHANFRAPLALFYRDLRGGWLRKAA